DRGHVHGGPDSLAPDESEDELDRLGGRAVAAPFEDDLGTHEERRVAFGRELHRPALAGTMSEARAPARKSEVDGVVVRRLVAFGRGLTHDRADEPVDARHVEVGCGGELQLAFWAVLHGRLSVAPDD